MSTATERPPPYASEGPSRGPHRNALDTDSRLQQRRPSPTLAYVGGRERVLGGRLVLHREPEVAAALAVEVMGPLGARAWARRLLAEMEAR